MSNDQYLENEYLGITEAAEYLRVSASTLRRWEKKGFLVPERTPTGIRRYTKKQLDDVIQAPQEPLIYTPPQHDSPKESPTEDTIDNNEYILNQQNISNVTWNTISDDEEHQEEAANSIPHLAVPEDGSDTIDQNIESVSSFSSQDDDEVDQLRDFFKKAGYETPEEQVHTIEPIHVSTTKVTQGSEFNTPQDDAYNLLSLHDITQEEFIANTVEPKTQTSSPPNVSQPIPNASEVTIARESSSTPTFSSMIGKTSYTQNTSIPALSRSSEQAKPSRSEIFHEEHADTPLEEPVKSDYRVHKEDSELHSSSALPDTNYDLGKDKSYHSNTVERPQHKKNILLYVVILVVFVMIVVVAWLAYSYFSAPSDLYSPVID